ncbi:MAG: hypothetical protein DMF62_04920 [Acidobacteria bacterium]|nr:MAG: hypothetical protein DMF62_04920 [Acidobacteriota bacterium]
MGLNEDYHDEWNDAIKEWRKEKEQQDKANQLQEWWGVMDSKRRRQMKRAERKAMRSAVWDGFLEAWDPRRWDWVVVICWVLMVAGCVGFWWLVFKKAVGR